MRLLFFAALASATPLLPRQDAALTYEEFTTSASITYRVAVPAGATAPYDVAFQIEAPAAVGWAGIAWGGGMLNNPLVVAWPNGDSVTVSARIAAYVPFSPPPFSSSLFPLLTHTKHRPENTRRTRLTRPQRGYQAPSPYPDATITPQSATVNETHWSLSALCTGCSSWAGGALPSGPGPLAWAYAAQPPATPADPASRFGHHDDKGVVQFDFAAAAVEGFEELVGGGAAEEPAEP